MKKTLQSQLSRKATLFPSELTELERWALEAYNLMFEVPNTFNMDNYPESTLIIRIQDHLREWRGE